MGAGPVTATHTQDAGFLHKAVKKHRDGRMLYGTASFAFPKAALYLSGGDIYILS